MDLIIIKSIIVVALVLSLTTIAEKVGTKISGILSGLPIGTLLVLLFFAIEYGVIYVEDASLYNIHGLFATLSFVIGYYISTFYTGKLEVIFSLLISFMFYLVVSFALSFITPNIFLTPIIIFILLLSSAIYFAKKEDFNVVEISTVSIYEVTLRSALTVVVFLIISILPQYLPVNFAGIFSSFPTILLPLILIIHFKHSNLQARTIIKNTPFGLTSVVAYSYIVHFTYPTIGITFGTIVGLICAVVVIYIQILLFKYFKITK